MIPPDKLCFVKMFVEVGFQKTQLEGSERLLARAFTTSCSKPFSKTKSFGWVGGWGCLGNVATLPQNCFILYTCTETERERERKKKNQDTQTF